MKKTMSFVLLSVGFSASAFADCSALISRHQNAVENDPTGLTYIFASLEGRPANNSAALARSMSGSAGVNGRVLSGHLTQVAGSRDVSCTDGVCTNDNLPLTFQADFTLNAQGTLTVTSVGRQVSISGTCERDGANTWKGTGLSISPAFFDSEALVLRFDELTSSRD